MFGRKFFFNAIFLILLILSSCQGLFGDGQGKNPLNNIAESDELRLLNNEIALNPSADAYYRRGIYYYKREIYERSIRDFYQAIDMKQDFTDAYFYRGNSYFERGDYDAALKDFNKSVELKPDYAFAYLNAGKTYYKQNDYENALKNYTNAIDVKPDYAEAYAGRGVCYERKKFCSEANADFQKACGLGYTNACSFNCH